MTYTTIKIMAEYIKILIRNMNEEERTAFIWKQCLKWEKEFYS